MIYLLNSVNKSKFVFTPQLHGLSCKVYFIDNKKSVSITIYFELYCCHSTIYNLFQSMKLTKK